MFFVFLCHVQVTQYHHGDEVHADFLHGFQVKYFFYFSETYLGECLLAPMLVSAPIWFIILFGFGLAKLWFVLTWGYFRLANWVKFLVVFG